MRLAISQIDTRAGDLARTAARMVAQSYSAASRGAELLVFPVPALTGPLPVAFGAQAPFVADVLRTLVELAGNVVCPCLVPYVREDRGLLVTEYALLLDGGVVPVRREALSGPTRPGAHDAERPVVLPVAEVAGCRLAIARTYDDLDALCRLGAQGAYDVALYLDGLGYAVDDISSALGSSIAEARYVDDALMLRRWLVAVSAVGGYGSQVFCGSSFFLAPDGRLAACAAAFEEDLIIQEVGPQVTLPMGYELAPEIYDERAFLWQALVVGLRDYVEECPASHVVLPLDGSLGSMVLAALATDALGPTRVHALDCVPRGHARAVMPAVLARTLRIDVRELDGALVTLAGGDARLLHDFAQAQLGALAREVGGVALSPQDKTSLALDGWPRGAEVAAFAPLGDVYRIDVLDMARLRNTVSPVFDAATLVPGDVPHLVDMRVPLSDEALLEHIDAVLATHVEAGRPLTEAGELAGGPDLARVVLERLAQHRMRHEMLPDCLFLTSCPLAEYRLPHGFAWADHLRDASVGEGEPIEGSAFQDDDAWEDDQADDAPYGDATHEQALHDALDLLRDLSVGIGTDWRNPFSEN